MFNIDYSKLSIDYKNHPLKDSKEFPPEQDIKYLFLDLNLDREEISQIMNTTIAKVYKWCRFYGLKKTKEQINECKKRVCLKKYGVENPMQRPEIREKAKQTCLKKYGVTNARKVPEFKEKAKQTCLMRYGTTSPMQNKEVKEKVKNTNLERYGGFAPTQNKQVLKKRKQNNLEKYGETSPTKTTLVKEKMKQTMLERYGVDNANKCPEIREKGKKTCLKKYGVENPMQNKEVKEKVKNTNLERYGCIHAMQLEEFQEKSKKSCLEKYGVEYTSQIPETREQARITMKNKFGVDYAIQNEQVKDKRRKNNIQKWGTSNISTKHLSLDTLNLINNKDSLINYIKNNNLTSIYEISEHLNVSYSTILKKLSEFNCRYLVSSFISKAELELSILFPDFYKTRKIIYPYEIDLFNSELKLGIEFNGDYWHCDELKPKLYHQNKSKLAMEKGVFIYHIFEYEWNNPKTKEIILSQLNNLTNRNQNKIGARKCTLIELTSAETNLFLNDNHIQGIDQSSIRYGLIYNNELVAVMTFCKPRFNKNYDLELSRYCCKKNTSVIGAASKLFKFFTSKYPNYSVISYSNISKTRGLIYPTLGFTLLHISTPNYVWINNYEILSRYQTQKHLLVPEYDDFGTTETEIMRNRGFLRVYDCGNKVWSYIP